MKYLKLSPSALFLIIFVISMFVSWVYPWYLSLFFDSGMIRFTGIVILLISLMINILSYREFKKFLTPHAPFSTPKILIQKGVYKFSRNPVYLALVLSQFGLGFVFDTLWLLVGALILLILLHYTVVLDEEEILESTFKVEYVHYKQHTRRWI